MFYGMSCSFFWKYFTKHYKSISKGCVLKLLHKHFHTTKNDVIFDALAQAGNGPNGLCWTAGPGPFWTRMTMSEFFDLPATIKIFEQMATNQDESTASYYAKPWLEAVVPAAQTERPILAWTKLNLYDQKFFSSKKPFFSKLYLLSPNFGPLLGLGFRV